MNVVVERTNNHIKWVILWRESRSDPWQVHRHQSGAAFRFNDLTYCSGEIRRRRKNGEEALAVREDRAFLAYGVTV
jgi:hypothetical protein